MVQKSLAQQTQSEPPSPPSKGNPPPKPDEVCLTPQEWEEVCDCSQALFAGHRPSDQTWGVRTRLQ